jgi:hypothetical protein
MITRRRATAGEFEGGGALFQKPFALEKGLDLGLASAELLVELHGVLGPSL